ncbi:MAG: nuclear transport factor 2 family protein [Chitinophagaceae bacterium]|nr:nuclear transport factor 2 family protein [Chitinophagaceae bacterium]
MLKTFNKSIFLFLLTIVCVAHANAQTAEDSIKAVINKMFVGMKDGDTNMIKECFTEGAILQTFMRQKDGKTGLTKETVSDFCRAVAGIPKGAADEQITFGAIKIDGPMAAVWTPFKLYFNEKFYSCGVNSFQLVKLSGEWKIQYIIDTRRTKNCD